MTKWRVLRGRLRRARLATSSAVIEVCGKLHNFVLRNDSPLEGLTTAQIQARIDPLATAAGGHNIQNVE